MAKGKSKILLSPPPISGVVLMSGRDVQCCIGKLYFIAVDFLLITSFGFAEKPGLVFTYFVVCPFLVFRWNLCVQHRLFWGWNVAINHWAGSSRETQEVYQAVLPCRQILRFHATCISKFSVAASIPAKVPRPPKAALFWGLLLAQLLVVISRDMCHCMEKQQPKRLIKKPSFLGCLLLKFSFLYWWARAHFIFKNFLPNIIHFPASSAKANIPIILSCEVSWHALFLDSHLS